MKTTRRIIAIALSLLLVSGNMAFAQNQKGLSSKKLTQKVERTVAKAAQKEKPLSVQYMGEIIAKNKQARKIKEKGFPWAIASMGGILIGGVIVGLIFGSSGVGFYISVIGESAAIPASFYAAGQDSPLAYLDNTDTPSYRVYDREESYGRYPIHLSPWGKRNFPFLADSRITDPIPNTPQDYVKIQNALGRDILEYFSVLLVNPGQVTKDEKNALIQFLAHPRRNYMAEKLKNGQYRFYFMNLRRDVYVDIVPEQSLIFLRKDGLSPSHYRQPTAHLILSPLYKE